MKLIITIIPDTVTDSVSLALTSQKFRVTQIASTGGFLRKGNSTLLIGVEDEHLEEALSILRENVKKTNDSQKGVVFVIKVEKFIHF
ncbi:MAG: cyclic-di-AMP receptor [Flexilinea sp.]|jgi:uncharacterized protein YaaQ